MIGPFRGLVSVFEGMPEIAGALTFKRAGCPVGEFVQT
jgi:hypothetical protein